MFSKSEIVGNYRIIRPLGDAGRWLYWGQSPQTIHTDDLLAIPASAPEG